MQLFSLLGSFSWCKTWVSWAAVETCESSSCCHVFDLVKSPQLREVVEHSSQELSALLFLCHFRHIWRKPPTESYTQHANRDQLFVLPRSEISWDSVVSWGHKKKKKIQVTDLCYNLGVLARYFCTDPIRICLIYYKWALSPFPILKKHPKIGNTFSLVYK